MKRNLGTRAAALALGAAACTAAAQEAPQASDTIVITAARSAQTVDEALASVTIITRRDLEREQAQTLGEALRGVEGLTLANDGGPGKQTSVFLRGTNANQLLVLIDGVKAGSASVAQFAFQDIPVDAIERIEIVRGPRSSLYGSEAIGGVIQIFTRRGGGPARASASVGAGSYGSYKASAEVSGGGARSWYSAGATGSRSKGFNACSGDPATFLGCGVIEPDRDGYRNRSATLRAGYRFDDGIEAEVHALRVLGHAWYDGAFQNESRVGQDVYGLTLRSTPDAPWRVSTAVGRSTDRSENFLDGAFASRYVTLRDTASLQNEFDLDAQQQVTLGVDTQRDRLESDVAYARTSRANRGVYARYQLESGAHEIEASARHDQNEQFGGHDTGALAWGYAFAANLRLVASYGTAFKAPTFNDLYWPADAFSSGNPDLRPERSRSAELALRGAPRWGHWAVSAYRTWIDDLINWAPVGSIYEPSNIDRARIRGLEARLRAMRREWTFAAQATWLDPRSATPGASAGKLLPRRARQSARLSVDRQLGAWRAGLTLYGEGRRYEDLDNTVALAGYALLDLRAEYAFAPGWSLQLKAGNLLDQHYQTAAFYNQPGRNWFATLRYRTH